MQPRQTPTEVAQQYEQIAAELEAAAKHLRITAQHFREREVPRGCAHTFAAQGHLHQAQTQLATLAVLHASHSQLELIDSVAQPLESE